MWHLRAGHEPWKLVQQLHACRTAAGLLLGAMAFGAAHSADTEQREAVSLVVCISSRRYPLMCMDAVNLHLASHASVCDHTLPLQQSHPSSTLQNHHISAQRSLVSCLSRQLYAQRSDHSPSKPTPRERLHHAGKQAKRCGRSSRRHQPLRPHLRQKRHHPHLLANLVPRCWCGLRHLHHSMQASTSLPPAPCSLLPKAPSSRTDWFLCTFTEPTRYLREHRRLCPRKTARHACSHLRLGSSVEPVHEDFRSREVLPTREGEGE